MAFNLAGYDQSFDALSLTLPSHLAGVLQGAFTPADGSKLLAHFTTFDMLLNWYNIE